MGKNMDEDEEGRGEIAFSVTDLFYINLFLNFKC